ncbi:MAG: hypothetical protein CMJ23_14170, partial [Phycisphaerae bacterium]|nr:hypothetical protein [Phycisphaerae bacterium]
RMRDDCETHPPESFVSTSGFRRDRFSIERDEKIPWRSPCLETGDDRDEVPSPERVAAKTRRRGQRSFQGRPRVLVEAPRGSSAGPDIGPACDAGVLGVQRDEEAGCQ